MKVWNIQLDCVSENLQLLCETLIGGQQQKKSYFIQADDDGIGEKCKVNKKIAKHAAAKSCQTFQLFTVRVHTSGQDASKQEAIKMQSGGKIQGSHH